jgi:hypothetical protein
MYAKGIKSPPGEAEGASHMLMTHVSIAWFRQKLFAKWDRIYRLENGGGKNQPQSSKINVMNYI